MKEKLYKTLRNFLSTSRYDKPHGILLLYFPCIWGLLINDNNITDVIFLCMLFLLGSCGMRALGCIWNDINDVDIDQKVLRTKNRMIVSKKVTKFEILTFSFVNLSIGVIPLFYISDRAVVVAFLVVPLIVSYPFMKRITWWPQFWLGLNFNWGLFVGFASVTDKEFVII